MLLKIDFSILFYNSMFIACISLGVKYILSIQLRIGDKWVEKIPKTSSNRTGYGGSVQIEIFIKCIV
jgi:hypothetical protein